MSKTNNKNQNRRSSSRDHAHRDRQPESNYRDRRSSSRDHAHRDRQPESNYRDRRSSRGNENRDRHSDSNYRDRQIYSHPQQYSTYGCANPLTPDSTNTNFLHDINNFYALMTFMNRK